MPQVAKEWVFPCLHRLSHFLLHNPHHPRLLRKQCVFSESRSDYVLHLTKGEKSNSPHSKRSSSSNLPFLSSYITSIFPPRCFLLEWNFCCFSAYFCNFAWAPCHRRPEVINRADHRCLFYLQRSQHVYGSLSACPLFWNSGRLRPVDHWIICNQGHWVQF